MKRSCWIVCVLCESQGEYGVVASVLLCGDTASLLGRAESYTNCLCPLSATPLLLCGVTWCHLCPALHESGLHEFLHVWIYGSWGEQLRAAQPPRPAVSAVGCHTWSRTAPPPAARWFSSSSNKHLNLQQSQ